MSRKKLTREILSQPEAFETILARIATEKEGTPYQICKGFGLSWGAVIKWVSQDTERLERFKAAMEVRAHLIAEDALQIADTAKPKTVHVAKLRVETRKWLAARFNPKWFGEKNQVEHSGEVTGSLMHILQSLPRAVEEESARIGGNQSLVIDMPSQESAGSNPAADAHFKKKDVTPLEEKAA